MFRCAFVFGLLSMASQAFTPKIFNWGKFRVNRLAYKSHIFLVHLNFRRVQHIELYWRQYINDRKEHFNLPMTTVKQQSRMVMLYWKELDQK